MTSAKNWEQLKKQIESKAKKGMEKEVLPSVKGQMQRSIKSKVYDVYPEPQHYERRGFNGGLGDSENIVGNIENKDNGFNYIVENITKGKNDDSMLYLAPLIIMGQEKAMMNNYGLLYDKAKKPYSLPRDFISDTEQRLDEDELARKLRSYMEK